MHMFPTQFNMFPTQFKSKIPRSLSYPLGAEAISAALQDTPQADFFRLRFFFYNTDRAASPGHPKEAFFEVRYLCLTPSLTTSRRSREDGSYEPRWEIEIRPVPHDDKRAIRRLMEEQGFPRVREWLIHRRHLFGEK